MEAAISGFGSAFLVFGVEVVVVVVGGEDAVSSKIEEALVGLGV